MGRLADELQNVLHYDELHAIDLFDRPDLEKRDVVNYIVCPRFDKAQLKVQQTRERDREKARKRSDEIGELSGLIQELKLKRLEWSSRASGPCDTTDADSVSRQNHAAQSANTLRDRILHLIERHDDMVERHNQALDESRERTEELNEDSLALIEGDLVAALDKCSKLADRLSANNIAADVVAALEVYFLEFKIAILFEDLLDDKAARNDCRNRAQVAGQSITTICSDDQVFQYIDDFVQRILMLIDLNAGLYEQLATTLSNADQVALSDIGRRIEAALQEKVITKFSYESVIDPAKLDDVLSRMNGAINAMRLGTAMTRAAAELASGPTARAALDAHAKASGLLQSMKAHADDLGDAAGLTRFVSTLLDERTINEVYSRESKPVLVGLRTRLLKKFGEERLDRVLRAGNDPYFLAKGAKIIADAALLRVQVRRTKLEEHEHDLARLIDAVERDVRKAAEVPAQNAQRLEAQVSKLCGLAWVPFLGLFLAHRVAALLKLHEPAFQSSYKVYHDCGSQLSAQNRRAVTILLVLAAVVGVIGAAVLAFVSVPWVSIVLLAAAGFYGIAAALLNAAGSRVRSALAVSVPIGL